MLHVVNAMHLQTVLQTELSVQNLLFSNQRKHQNILCAFRVHMLNNNELLVGKTYQSSRWASVGITVHCYTQQFRHINSVCLREQQIMVMTAMCTRNK